MAADAFSSGYETDVASTDGDARAASVALDAGDCSSVVHVELEDGNFVARKRGKEYAVV